MEKKEGLGKLVQDAGKAAKNLWGSAAQAADQNGDGKFDLEDVAAIAGAVGGAAKRGTQAAATGAAEKLRRMERKALQPLFPEDLMAADFHMPKLIRLAERDKKRAESEVCQGSVGYTSEEKGLRIVHIFRDSAGAFGLSFCPDQSGEFYYVDPSDEGQYIALDQYFHYLERARISELQRIAQALGAKHFRVTYKETAASTSEKKSKLNAKAGKVTEADVSRSSGEESRASLRVAAENELPGHAPVRPQLRYLRQDQNIQSLIAMRLDENNPLLHQKHELEVSSSCGITEHDAAKIDAVLKGMKCSIGATVTSEARKEAKKYLTYDIEF